MKVFWIATVNLRRFLRERSNIFFVFVFPIALILVLGSLFGGGFQPRLGVVIAPGAGPLARDLLEELEAQRGVDVVPYEDAGGLLDAVERGSAAAGVVIPQGYDEALVAGETVEVGFLARPDGVGPTLQLTLAAAIGEQTVAVQSARFASSRSGVSFAEALAAAAGIEGAIGRVEIALERVGEQVLGEDVQQFDLGAPSQLVLFMFLTGLTASAALIQSRQLGISRRMLSTPTPTWEIVTGEALGRFAVVLFQGLYIMGATWLLFGVDWGDPAGAVALLLAFSLVGAGAGMLMGSIFSNDQQAGGVAVLIGLGLAALGGAMVPLEIFSPTMQDVAHLTPHAWALDGFADLLRRGGSFVDVLAEVGVLLGFASVLLVAAAWRLRSVLTSG